MSMNTQSQLTDWDSIFNFINQQRSKHTKRAYAADLRRFIDFVDGREVDDALVIEWRESLVAGLKNASAVRVFNTVRSYYNWAEIEPNPFRRVKAPQKASGWTPQFPSESEIDAVISVCDSSVGRVILNLLNNGLRAQEVCDLKGSDITYDEDEEGYLIRVTGKGNKIRLVPATDETELSLTNLDLLHGRDERLFDGLNTRAIYRLVDRCARLAKVKGMHPHAFRHSYATRLTRAGVPVPVLQKLLGHKRMDTTGIYVNLDTSDLFAATRKDPRATERPRLRIVS